MKNLYQKIVTSSFTKKFSGISLTTVSPGKNLVSNLGKSLLGLSFLLIVTFSFLSNTVFAQQVTPGTAPVTTPTNGFGIDGDLKAFEKSFPAPATVNNIGDWLPSGCPALPVGGVLDCEGDTIPGQPKPYKAYHFVDLFTSGDDVFSGGKKKNDYIDSKLTWKNGNPSPAKCDINHFMMHIAKDDSLDTWIVLAGDREEITGNSFISLQFLQETLEQVSSPTKRFVSQADSLTGGRTVGDLQVSAEFTNGGGNPNLYLERWELVGNVYKWVPKTFKAGDAMGAVNTGIIINNAYTMFGDNPAKHTYQPNAFIEVALNISDIIADVSGGECFGKISTLWVQTKTSQSETAALTDFVTPIQINLDINLEPDAGPDKAICAGDSVMIGTAAQAGIAYSWSPATGLSDANIAQPKASPSATTDYILTISQTGSTCNTTDTVTVTVNPVPVISGLTIGAICAGTDSASLAYTGLTGGANQYKIDWGTMANDSGLVDIASYIDLPASPIILHNTGLVPAGTYTGTIFVQDSTTGCPSIGAIISLTINPNPVLSITNPPAVCSPLKVDLTAAGVTDGSELPTGTVLNYFTDAGATTHVDDSTSVGAGTYYILAISPAGCTDIKPVTVTVNPKPILTLHAPDAVCSGDSVSLIAAGITAGSTLPTGTVLSYFTDANATTHVLDSTAVVSGTYYIKATAPGGCFDIDFVEITVKDELARPVVTITEATLCDTIAAPKLEVLCPVEGGKYTLVQTGETDRIITYSGSGALIFYNLKPGKGGDGFSITLEFEDCISAATTCKNYTENQCPVDERRANPKPQGSAFTKEMKAYPVPFYDNVTIQFTSDRDEDYVVNLYDVQGRLVKQLKAGYSKAGEVMQIEVDGSNLPGNFYVARKISKSGVSIVKLLKAE